MIARLVLWSLADTAATIDELRDVLDEQPAEVPGRRYAAWISDESSERFGEFSLWETPEDSELAGPGPLRDVIGRDPEVWEQFDVEGWAR